MDLRTGSWIIRTLLDQSDAAHSELLDIATLSETRLSGYGSLQEPDSGYTIFYKGRSENVSREGGVDFVLKYRLISHLPELPDEGL